MTLGFIVILKSFYPFCFLHLFPHNNFASVEHAIKAEWMEHKTEWNIFLYLCVWCAQEFKENRTN